MRIGFIGQLNIRVDQPPIQEPPIHESHDGVRAGLQRVDEHGEVYLLCERCLSKRAKRAVVGWGSLAIVVLIGGALIGAGIMAIWSRFASTSPEWRASEGWAILQQIASTEASLLLGALGVLVTLMIAIAVASEQTTRQITRLESTAIETDTLDLATLDSLRRNGLFTEGGG